LLLPRIVAITPFLHVAGSPTSQTGRPCKITDTEDDYDYEESVDIILEQVRKVIAERIGPTG
jgi:hypothetical protein